MRSTPPALVTLLALVSLCAAPYCFAQPQQSSFDVKALDEKDRAKISLLKKVESVKKRVAPTTEQLLELLQECPEPEMRYDILVKLGESEIAKGGKQGTESAVNYLLQATILDPDRPEANLQLAQVYMEKGMLPESESYMRKATLTPHRRLSYDSVCLQVQSHMDQSRYYAAVLLIADVAFDRESWYYMDPYLLGLMWEAASLDDGAYLKGPNKYYYWPYYYWAVPVLCKMFGLDPKVVYTARNSLADQEQNMWWVEFSLSLRAYHTVMAVLRSSLNVRNEFEVRSAGGDLRYKLSPVVFALGDPRTPSPLKFDKELDFFELMLRASVNNEEELTQALKQVNELRAEAKRVCGGIKDEKERARALFDFLKSNLLVNYSVVDGIPAENALSKKYYLCLTGTLYYTLIGRKDLDLNVAGCLVPGHAYPVLQHSQLGPIEIETTASGNKNSVEYGFDYGRRRTMEARKRYDKAHEVGAQKGGLLFTSDKKGAVSNLDLVQSQYRNVVLNLPVLLFLRNPEYRNLAKANLTEIAALKVRDKNGLEVKFLDLVKQLREQFETEQNENPDYKWTGDDLDNFLDTLALIPCPAVDLINRKLVLEMAVKNESFRRDLVKTYEKMLALMEIALQLDPFDRDYRELYLQTLYFADGVEVGSILKKHRERFDEIQKLRFLVDPLTDSSRASATPRSMKLTQVGSDVDISNPQAINDRIKSLAKQDFEDAQARMPYLIAALDRDAKASEKYPQFDEIKHIFFRTANICSEYLKSLDEMAKYVPDIERPNSSALTIQLERIKSRYASKRASN